MFSLIIKVMSEFSHSFLFFIFKHQEVVVGDHLQSFDLVPTKTTTSNKMYKNYFKLFR